MSTTEENLAKIRAACERCAAIAEDPEYIRRAQGLEREWNALVSSSQAAETRIRRQASGIPAEHIEHLASPKLWPAFVAIQTFLAASTEKRFVILGGLHGVGKSFALAWGADQGGLFATAQNLVLSSSWDSYWAELKTARFVAIDELGAECGNPAYDANLYELLNSRYANMRKTAISTNLTPAAFRARYLALGLDRLLDRLKTGGEWVNCTGDSKRRHWSETDGEP
jgi:hypothetical protein